MTSEAELIEKINSSFENLRKGSAHPSKDKKILRIIRKIKSTTNSKLSINAAQWVLIYHMTGYSNSENPKQIQSLVKNAEADLNHALKLLDIEYADEDEKSHAQLLIADIAQKLGKFEKMAEVYVEISKRSAANPQLNFVVLSLAPTLADWNYFYRLCYTMEREYISQLPQKKLGGKKPDITEALHQLAESGIPDLGVIYSYVKENELYKRRTPAAKDLFEQTIAVEKVAMEVVKIVAETEQRAKEIKEDFEKEKENEFDVEDLSIAVNGGLIFFPGLSKEVPIMLYGPYFDEERIDVEGYCDLQLQKSVDEQGNPLEAMPSQAEIEAEFMQNMPQDMVEALRSGELNPETLMQLIAQTNGYSEGLEAPHGSQAVSPDNLVLAGGNGSNGVDLRDSFAQFSQRLAEQGPEMMKKYGLAIVRQQERFALRRCEGGYEGTYFIRNYNPVDMSDDTSITIAVKLTCPHFEPPAAAKESGPVEKIASGIDDLTLE